MTKMTITVNEDQSGEMDEFPFDGIGADARNTLMQNPSAETVEAGEYEVEFCDCEGPEIGWGWSISGSGLLNYDGECPHCGC